jgi:integrase
MRTLTLTQSTWTIAAAAWLESRRPYLSPRTYGDYKHKITILAQFFGSLRLTEISADEIRAYQRMRMARAGAYCINKECGILEQMLKRIGRWPEIAANYQPLPAPKESRHRALSPQEIEKLSRIGATNPGWEVAYCAFLLSINTSCGPGELRHLRRMDIDWDKRTLRVQPLGAKNEHRIRVIPLNGTAQRAMRHLWDRAERIGSVEPHHYIIPFRPQRGTYDPERPSMGWRYAWNEMCAAAGIRARPYDGRHTFITDVLSNPEISEEVCESIAGHISSKMKKRYSHQRLEVKRAAVEALERIAPQTIRAPSKNFKKA